MARKPLGIVELLSLYTLVPLVFASIYGMNIPLPFQNKHWAFSLFVGACITWFAIATAIVLLRQKTAQ